MKLYLHNIEQSRTLVFQTRLFIDALNCEHNWNGRTNIDPRFMA